MDLSNLDSVAACERGTEITIKDINEVDTDLVVEVVGIDSKTYQSEYAKLNARLQQAAKRGKSLSLAEQEDLWCQLTANCTTGWKNMTLNGEPVPFSPKKAHEIYMGYPLIKSQVFTAINNRAAFLGNVETSS